MADGTILNSMSGGDKIDSEDLGSRGKLQRIKVVIGSLDTDSGDVSAANPIPVTGTINVVGNVAAGTTDSGNAVKIGGVYNVSAPTYTNGQRADAQFDSAGNLKVNLATAISGEDATANRLMVEQRNNYSNITSSTTTVVKASGGFLKGITVNQPGASSWQAIVYDNTAASGTKIATIVFISGISYYPFNVLTNNGITVVTSAGTAGDITVSYR